MDRHTRTLAGAGCGLLLLLAASGCRSMRSEVPPGRAYTSDGRQVPPVGFSSDPHPMTGNALSGLPDGQPGTPGTSSGQPGAIGQFGTPAPGSTSNWGAPTNNAYGPPGTAGATMTPGVGLAPPSTDPLSPSPSATVPQTGPAPGTMGVPGAPPSPL